MADKANAGGVREHLGWCPCMCTPAGKCHRCLALGRLDDEYLAVEADAWDDAVRTVQKLCRGGNLTGESAASSLIHGLGAGNPHRAEQAAIQRETPEQQAQEILDRLDLEQANPDESNEEMAAFVDALLAVKAEAWEQGVRAAATFHAEGGHLFDDIDWPPERLDAKLAENPYR